VRNPSQSAIYTVLRRRKQKKIRGLFSEVINSAHRGIYHDSKFSSDNEILRKASHAVIMERRKTISREVINLGHTGPSVTRRNAVM